MYVPDDGEIVVHMWRQTDERKVWYEWMVDVYGATQPTGEGRGRATRVKIGGSELHSSVKEACLM